MKYVLDASVGLKWELSEPNSDKANQLRADFSNQVHELLAPDSFPLEVAHALTKAERQGKIPDAQSLWVDVMTTCPVLHPCLPLMLRALQIASQARIGVYDCIYIALAEREACELLTADERLVRALGPSYPFIISLASLP
jgi:predicted nucleic acid-binding protein